MNCVNVTLPQRRLSKLKLRSVGVVLDEDTKAWLAPCRQVAIDAGRNHRLSRFKECVKVSLSTVEVSHAL